MADRERILKIRDLNISFKIEGKKVNAIRGVNLDLYKGETIAIVGESGSGKSVTTKAIMGILAKNGSIESGSILLSIFNAYLLRGANASPLISFVTFGGEPGIVYNSGSSVFKSGIADKRPQVYGCKGL